MVYYVRRRAYAPGIILLTCLAFREAVEYQGGTKWRGGVGFGWDGGLQKNFVKLYCKSYHKTMYKMLQICDNFQNSK